MKSTILCISDSDKQFDTAIQEYTKRLGKSCEIINCKPAKHGTHQQIINTETQTIIEKLEKTHANIILLSKEGKAVTTTDIKTTVEAGKHICFVIGGPYGLDEPLLEKVPHTKRSFGAITLPHGLAKLILLEQLYRAQTILQGKKYHY